MCARVQVTPLRSDRFLLAAVPVLVAVAVFPYLSSGALGTFAPLDDNQYVLENPGVPGGVSWEGVRWAFGAPHFGYWIPLTWLSHMADVELYGLWAGGHHLTNVLLHGANAALLFFLLHALTGARGRSLFAAALFALHPLRVESVAWVTERKDVLSALFGLLALLAHLRSRRRPGARWVAVAVLLLAASLMAKPMLVTFPALLVLLDWWPLGRLRGGGAVRRIGALVVEKWPYVLTSAAATFLAFSTQRTIEMVPSFGDVPFGWRIGNVLLSYRDYLAKTFWPAGLSVSYPPRGLPVPLPQQAAALLLLAVVTVLVFTAVRRRRSLAFGWLWFLVALVPVGGFIQVRIAIADRFTYLPHVGLGVALVWAAAESAPARIGLRRAAVAGGSCVLMCLMLATHLRLGDWRDTATLFRQALQVTSGNAVALNNLGVALNRQGDASQAIVLYREALALFPEYPLLHNNLGVSLMKTESYASAEAEFRTALAGEPGRALYLQNLGVALALQGRTEEALGSLRAAIRAEPGLAWARVYLGAVLLRSGAAKEAHEELSAVVRLDPGFAPGWNNLGSALTALGREEEAVDSYRTALRLEPGYAGAHFNLALALSQVGRPEEALLHYQRALELAGDGGTGAAARGVAPEADISGGAVAAEAGPDPAAIRANLGNALVLIGRAADSIPHFERVTALRPAWADGYYNLGRARAALGDFAGAIRDYQAALEREPARADVHNNLGVALVSLGRFPGAIRSYREALRLDPGLAAASVNLGNALHLSGRSGEALEVYRETLARFPAFPEAHYNMALVLKALGRDEEALREFAAAERLAGEAGRGSEGRGGSSRAPGPLSAAP